MALNTFRTQAFTDLQTFFVKHKAVRILQKKPEGVDFYETLLDPELMRMLELHDFSELHAPKKVS